MANTNVRIECCNRLGAGEGDRVITFEFGKCVRQVVMQVIL